MMTEVSAGPMVILFIMKQQGLWFDSKNVLTRFKNLIHLRKFELSGAVRGYGHPVFKNSW